jgi:hypothetical protein
MDVGYALRRARQLHADAIAAYDGERSITFAQFADRVTRGANARCAIWACSRATASRC